jgi:hypothetical protein
MALLTKEVLAEVGVSLDVVVGILRRGKLDPPPSKDASGRLKWEPADVARLRAVLLERGTRRHAIEASDPPGKFRFRSDAGPCVISGAKGENKLATFSGVAYTGAPMRPSGWFGSIIIDLAGLKIPSQHRPVLRQHDFDQLLGHTTSIRVASGELQVMGVFSGRKEDTEKVVIPAGNGFEWQMSVGADPIRTERLEAGQEAVVNGRKVTGPMTISRETQLGEISFVPLGADGDTSVSVAATQAGVQQLIAAERERIERCKAVHARFVQEHGCRFVSDDGAEDALVEAIRVGKLAEDFERELALACGGSLAGSVVGEFARINQLHAITAPYARHFGNLFEGDGEACLAFAIRTGESPANYERRLQAFARGQGVSV